MNALARHAVVVVAALGALVAPIGASAAANDAVARGAYLVKGFGCGDCHTPMKMGPQGPEPDLVRGLSGHPQETTLPPPPTPVGPWIGASVATNTAFAGPWGISYSANITSDPGTGIGAWKAADFVKAMRTGKHLGVGRSILPPMPVRSLGKMSDPDLEAMFAYLKAQPPVVNAVPEPTPPSR